MINITPANIAIAPATIINIAPNLTAPLPFLFTAINKLINKLNAPIATIPLVISSTDIIPISLHTPTISNNDTDNPIIITPNLAAFSPPNLDTTINADIKIPIAVIKAIPFITSSAFNIDANFITAIIINKDVDIFRIIFPNLSASLAFATFVIFIRLIINA